MPAVKLQILSTNKVSGGFSRSVTPVTPLLSVAVYSTPVVSGTGAKVAMSPVAASRVIDVELTGVDPGEIRARLGDPGFQLAVLDHLAGDEALLVAFAAAEGIPPEAVGRARRARGAVEE